LAAERERSRRYQQTLIADSRIELAFELRDGDVFEALASLLESRIEFEGAVPTADGRLLHYLTAVGAAPSGIESVVSTLPQVDECRVVFPTDESVFLELDLNQSPIRTLLDAGTIPKSVQSEAGHTTVLAEAGVDTDLGAVIHAFSEEYPTATVVTKRTLTRPIVTTRQYRDSLARSLTDRQTETLRAAYLAGYYEWPRNSKSEQIAASMGIATSTWLRHLRLAESKLVRWFFEELEA
jgi:hypothetical protein